MEGNLRVKNSIEDSERLAKECVLYWAKVFWKDCFNIVNEISCYSEQYFVVEEFVKQKAKFYSNKDIAKELYIVGNICSSIFRVNE